MSFRKIIIPLFMLLPCLCASAQDTVPVLGKKQYDIIRGGAANSAAMKLFNSLEEHVPDEQIADNYMELAGQLTAKGEHVKAEEYMQKAVVLYEKNAPRNKTAQAYRELAKAQEAQGKIEDAIRSYENASTFSRRKEFSRLNSNDANRLRNASDVVEQGKYIADNLKLLGDNSIGSFGDGFSDKVDAEMSIAYRQMANTQSDEYSRKAYLGMARSKSEFMGSLDKTDLRQELADLSFESESNATDVSKVIVAEAQKISDPKEAVRQLQVISDVLLDAKQPEVAEIGVESLRESYDIAMANSHTLDARRSVQMLADRYRSEGENDKAMAIYADYVGRLEQIVLRDSTLMEDNIFVSMEDKISRLEKERELQGELIVRQNRFNYVLMGSVVLVLIFLVVIARALGSIKRKNKRIALQSLRREMNPHFIFNSLNSVNQFIAENNEMEANKYLTSYSRLMRKMMESSNKDFIPLSDEIEQLKEYLELEHMRFKDKFDYRIVVDEGIDPQEYYVPNMLIQPQLENAIWHGLRYLDGGGMLTVTFTDECDNGGRLCVTIEDNGIGIKKSQELKTAHQKERKSRGLTNTYERIALLNSLYNQGTTIEIREKADGESGVVVKIYMPVLYRSHYAMIAEENAKKD